MDLVGRLSRKKLIGLYSKNICPSEYFQSLSEYFHICLRVHQLQIKSGKLRNSTLRNAKNLKNMCDENTIRKLNKSTILPQPNLSPPHCRRRPRRFAWVGRFPFQAPSHRLARERPDRRGRGGEGEEATNY